MESLNIQLGKIQKGAIFAFSGLFIAKFLGYLYKFIAARIGVESYGVLSLGIMVYGLINIIALFGIDGGVTRFTAYYLGQNNGGKIKSLLKFSAKIIIPLSLIGSLFLFFYSDYIALTFFKNQELTLVLKLFSIIIPFEAIRAVYFGIIRGFQNLKYEFYSKYIVEGTVRIFLTLILIYLGFGLIGATIAYIGAVIMSFIFAQFYLLKIYKKIKTKTSFLSKLEKNDFLSYSWPFMFHTILGLALISIDSFMLGYFKPISEVGIYNAIAPIARLTYIIPISILSLFIPTLTRLYAKNDLKMFKSIYLLVYKFIFKLNFPLLLIIIIFPQMILSILFGNVYVVGYQGLVILTAGFFVMYYSFVSRDLLFVFKKSKVVSMVSLMAVLINIVLNYILIRPYGVLGAAIASSISLFFFGFLIFIIAYIQSKIFPFDKKYLGVLISGIFSVIIIKFIARFLDSSSKIITIFLIFNFLIIYLFLLFITKSIEKEEKIFIKEIYSLFITKMKSFKSRTK